MRWRDVKQNKASKIKEPQKPSSPALPYATIAERMKAFITDAFLLSMPLFYIVIYLFFDGLRGADGVEGHRLEAWLYVLIPLGIIVSLFYAKTGQTPGLKAHSLKLIDNQTLEKPSLMMAALRYFFFNVAFFSFFGLLISFFRKDRRGLQDLLSGTSIIKVSDA